MQKSKILRGFLDSVNVAAVAVMVSVLFTMALETLITWQAIVIAIVATVLVFGLKKVSVIWVVVIGALLGWLLGFQF